MAVEFLVLTANELKLEIITTYFFLRVNYT